MSRFAKKHLDFHRVWSKAGVAKPDYFRILRLPGGYLQTITVEFRGYPTYFASPYWFLHSVREIFVDEVYRYNPSGSSPVIIDCGANIGLSVVYFKELCPGAKIVAFEPDPAVFDLLKKNVLERSYTDVELVNEAVWVDNSILNFSAEGALGGKVSDDKSKSELIAVQGKRLRDVLDRDIDFLKLDIEGAEYAVLEDCKDLLGNVRNLFVEYHCDPDEDQRLHNILDWIANAGFRYYVTEASPAQAHPFISRRAEPFEMQLNISCYRKDGVPVFGQ
ncbi:MAG: FkbM family methyltransferase [Pyrinomonadaceae bacterium]